MKLDLSTGDTVEMFDPEDVTAGRRKGFFKDLDLTKEGNLKTSNPAAVTDLAIASFIISWSLEATLPTPALVKAGKATALDDLKIRDYDKLAEVASEILRGITPDFEPTPDPKAPIESSDGSGE